MKRSDVLAIVPARAGSVRLPGKNRMLVGGVPLWRRAVDLAVDCGLSCVVTTDDDEIRGAFEHRLVTYVRRPPALAQACSIVWDAVEHVCYYREHFGPIVLLQPTSPNRSRDDLTGCLDMFKRGHNVTSVRDVGGNKWEPNGSIYVREWKTWSEIGHEWWMPDERGIDINTKEDFDRAERWFRLLDKSEPAGE